MIIPVILCGGSGTRLWPVSREIYPKQFLNLLGQRSLLQNTVNRAVEITGAARSDVVIVTLADFRADVAAQLGEEATHHVLCEPSARNTAAAIACAAIYVRDTFGADAVLWVLPSDHHIGNDAELARAFKDAKDAAEQGYLVTFGIRPTRPDTGYGYILRGDAVSGGRVFSISQFLEKPDLERAAQYIADGRYLWNSGMFVFRAGSVIGEFEKYSADVLDAVARAIGGADAASPDAALYSSIPKVPFDIAIMERSDKGAVVPTDPAWSDIGSWESLWDASEKDSQDNAVKGVAALHDTKGCFIQGNGGRLIACAGVENLVIVDTGDAVLVADRSNSDAIRELVNKIKAKGLDAVLKKFNLPTD